MPVATNVKLPRDQEAVFPDRCIVCGRAQPDLFVRVRAEPIGLLSLLILSSPWIGGTMIDAPAHSQCRRYFNARRFWLRILNIFVIFVLVIGSLVFAVVFGFGGTLWQVGLSIGLVVLWHAGQARFPPAFGATCFKRTIQYEFADPDYAWEFQQFNQVE